MKVIIAGAGTYGCVYHEYLLEEGKHEIAGYVDDDPQKIGQTVNGLPVFCETTNFPRLRELGIEGVFCPIGDNKIRENLLSAFRHNGFDIPGFIHRSVLIHENVRIGEGVYILPGSIIMPFVSIEDFVMISMGVKVAHHTILRQAAFLSTGVNMGANVDFGNCAFAGIGSIVTTGIRRIGANALIGAGAVIIRDVPDHAVMVGNPGKVLRIKEPK